MWENSTVMQTQQPLSKKTRKAQRAQQEQNVLLTAQIVVCLMIVLLVFLIQKTQSSFLPQLSSAFDTMLSQGVSYDEDTSLIRFVNGGVLFVQEKTQAVLAQLTPQETTTLTGQGGKYATTKQQVPSTASLDSYTLAQALSVPCTGVVTSAFGFRIGPIDGTEDFHMGVDIAAPIGTPVYPVCEGQVTTVGYHPLRGNYIVIRHDSGFSTLYQHLSCSCVRVGEMVAPQQPIAGMGTTGYSTGSHLHLELIVNGLRVDPSIAIPTLRLL